LALQDVGYELDWYCPVLVIENKCIYALTKDTARENRTKEGINYNLLKKLSVHLHLPKETGFLDFPKQTAMDYHLHTRYVYIKRSSGKE